MFTFEVNEQTRLKLIEPRHAREVLKIINSNRDHLRRWLPWADNLCSVADVEKIIAVWRQQCAQNRGFQAGIWHEGQFCGMVGHLNVDWVSRWMILCYWLDITRQGRGIMTACCRAMIGHAFNEWNLHRVTIECATENERSCAVAKRLGFKLEGITRSSEWLHDHFADHSIYGLLKSEFSPEAPK